MNTSEAVQIFRNVQNIFQMASVLQLTAHLYPQSITVEDAVKYHYDFIIVGGGTAGCVIASRLVELKNVKVLLIEAGGNPPIESNYAGYFASMKGTGVDWQLNSIEEPYLQNHKGKAVAIPQGKMLGGTSSLNYLAYVRGDRTDYDGWATTCNDSSWSYESVLPYFIKAEKLIDEKVLKSPEDKALHGTKGRLKIRKFYYEDTEEYFSSFRELGYKTVIDINSRNPLGFTNLMYTCGEGVRQSTAYAYLRPVRNNRRLHVLTNALVTKIIFKGNNAIGVKVTIKDSETITVKAKKEVILTAGVYKTAQLLMISGIGPKEHLESKGIKVLKDLPVGKNLLDHPIVLSVYKMGKQKRSNTPKSPLRINFPSLDGYITLNKCKNTPDYMVRNVILDDGTVFLQICSIVFNLNDDLCDTLYKATAGNQISIAFSHLAYPKSQGEVLLDSTNIKDNPIIRLGLYSNQEDLRIHAEHVMNFTKILNTTYFKKVSAEFVDPKFKICSKFNMHSLEYWKCYILAVASSLHYNAGTCGIGRVVHSNLCVKGLYGLRVADSSIFPTVISSPTVATVIMIAEKASDIIKNDYY